MRLEAADVRVELRAEAVIDAYGLRARRRGKNYRLKECPRCREASRREAIAINAQTGEWLHHGHERAAGGDCSGDVLDLLAACEGLSCRRDFGRVMAIAAQLAGLDASMPDAEREQRRAVSRARAARFEAEERARMATAVERATRYWDGLALRSEVGEAYLADRQLNQVTLIAAGVVRFDAGGNVATPIRTISGRVISVATRVRNPGDGPKVDTLMDCSTRGTMVDIIAAIGHERDVVVVEGFADALTARLAWPSAIVLGANGAGNISRVVRAAIGCVRLVNTRLILVPHNDVEGIRSNIEAGRLAMAAGLELGSSLIIPEVEAKDLNDAWCAGWRPTEVAWR